MECFSLASSGLIFLLIAKSLVSLGLVNEVFFHRLKTKEQNITIIAKVKKGLSMLANQASLYLPPPIDQQLHTNKSQRILLFSVEELNSTPCPDLSSCCSSQSSPQLISQQAITAFFLRTPARAFILCFQTLLFPTPFHFLWVVSAMYRSCERSVSMG